MSITGSAFYSISIDLLADIDSLEAKGSNYILLWLVVKPFCLLTDGLLLSKGLHLVQMKYVFDKLNNFYVNQICHLGTVWAMNHCTYLYCTFFYS